MDTTNKDKFETWALIELFGHQRIVGKVSEAAIGGCSFLRVDVPASETEAAYTKFYGNGAVYAMTPIAEGLAMQLLKKISPEPVHQYDFPQLNPSSDDDDVFNDSL